MIVAITGGIGSGKSTVSRLFEMQGWGIFNSDIAAHQAYFVPGVKKKVVALLGPKAYLKKTINKDYIRSLIFSDPALLKKLNSIIHPAVKQLFNAFVKTNKGKPLVKESALLFEAGFEKDADAIIVVAAPDNLRIKRVMNRDGISRNAVIQRMNQQWSQDEKIKRAHYVINNNDDDSVIEQVQSILNALSSKK